MEDASAPWQVIYVTGAPAAGKSTFVRELKKRATPVEVFEYGERLTARLSGRLDEDLTQAQLRSLSSAVATLSDIAAVDDELIEFVHVNRRQSNVLIDSHAVTKEAYGFRVTAYSLSRFSLLNPTQVWFFYTDPDTTLRRIAADPAGRPLPSTWEAVFHTQLQAGVAASYAMEVGIPLHCFDSSRPLNELLDQLRDRMPLDKPVTPESERGYDADRARSQGA